VQACALESQLADAQKQRLTAEQRVAELERQLAEAAAAAQAEQARLGGELAGMRRQLDEAKEAAGRVRRVQDSTTSLSCI
jgi:hypothetical protein